MTQQPERLTKNERREAARAQAKAAREAQAKREKRNRLFIQGGVVLGVLAIIAVVALVVMQMTKPAGPGPNNMNAGGVVFEGENFDVRETPALEDGETPVAQQVDREDVPLDVVVYVDYICPHCSVFEQETAAMFEQWVGSGQATLQVYPVNILDNASKGSRYSTRAANAFACVVDEQPEAAWSVHSALLSPEHQPEMNTSGLTNDQLLDLLVSAGAEKTASLNKCVQKVPFGDFITATTKQALGGPLIGLEEGVQMPDGQGGTIPADDPQHITGTPTVIVNGQPAPTDPTALEQFMLKLFGELSGEDVGDEDAGADSAE